MKHETLTPFRPITKGNLCKRMLVVNTLASLWRNEPARIAADLWSEDRDLADLIKLKATSAPAMTSVAGWAQELAQRATIDTVNALGAAAGAADVMRAALLVNWNGAGIISAPGFVSSSSNSSFVQEGNPIPVRQLASAPAQLTPFKLATIAVLSREMIENSNAEALIADALVRSTGLALDAVFFGNAAASAAQPAGLRNGISTSTASVNTDPFGAVFEDIGTLITAVSAVGGKGPFVLVSSPGRIASLGMRFNPAADSNISYAISTAVGNDLIAIAPQAIVAAISADPDVETVNTGTLMMDTAPQVAGTTGQSERSLYQTDSLATKVRWPVSWALRDARAVAWLTPGWK
jgi:hypothetical protein